ncbi:prepilin-type N-terminal cleavage/methylation domain-containing protein [Spirochaeta isovalerica]|uniref:Prepilin-type N-terminal cleavage/methylation domain-containing protein n=1 Tax=Spirochaeta isovalerica TaxID=150 RepID=A0A841R7M4_9SPIO|nr:prepilin-type N-terminal cleavage/methylation domain-containing protein [Spirochaeta isovalerica]MBB6478492.1 prepilin-type N-terminal cleavage/methylation domain-containing protein [Spirochaeta isovalerica]
MNLFKALSNDDGYTFVEVLVAIAIISLSGFVLWAGISRGMSFAEKIRIRNRENSEIAFFEYLFREEIGKIGLPYYESGFEEYDGVFQEENLLIIERGAEKISFLNLSFADLKQTESYAEIHLHTVSGKDIMIKAPYGKYPLSGITADE